MAEGWSVKSILNTACEETAAGPASAMAVEHWHSIVKILRPETSTAEVKAALDELVAEGSMAFDPAVTITTHGGHRITLAGYYRA